LAYSKFSVGEFDKTVVLIVIVAFVAGIYSVVVVLNILLTSAYFRDILLTSPNYFQRPK